MPDIVDTVRHLAEQREEVKDILYGIANRVESWENCIAGIRVYLLEADKVDSMAYKQEMLNLIKIDIDNTVAKHKQEDLEHGTKEVAIREFATKAEISEDKARIIYNMAKDRGWKSL